MYYVHTNHRKVKCMLAQCKGSKENTGGSLLPLTSSSTASSRWGPDTPHVHAYTSWINCALLGPAALAHCFSPSLCHHAVAPPGPAFSSRPGILPAHSRCSINACPPEQNINRHPLGLRFCFVYCSFSVELFTPTVTIQERHSAVITREQKASISDFT